MSAQEPLSALPEDADGETERRGVIARRLTWAAVLVVSLLILLALFDAFSSTPDDDSARPPPYTDVVPVPPKAVQGITSGRDAPDDDATDDDQTNLPPEDRLAIPPEQPPEIVPETIPPPVPLPAPEAQTPSGGKPAASVPPRPQPPRVTSRTAQPPQNDVSPLPRPLGVVPPEFTAPQLPLQTTPPENAAQTTQQQPTAVLLPPERPRPTPPRLFSGFTVQAGVFTSFQRAEEIHAKLTLHGIPSTLETRVQVGPFKTQAEADAARKKMRELGIEGIVIPPARPRR